jgi:hypothetical protein
MAGGTLNELRQLKFEPRAATLAAHLVDVLRGDCTPLLFVDFYPADGCGFWGCDFQLHASDEQRKAGGVGGAFLHNQIPHGPLQGLDARVAPWQPPTSREASALHISTRSRRRRAYSCALQQRLAGRSFARFNHLEERTRK